MSEVKRYSRRALPRTRRKRVATPEACTYHDGDLWSEQSPNPPAGPFYEVAIESVGTTEVVSASTDSVRVMEGEPRELEKLEIDPSEDSCEFGSSILPTMPELPQNTLDPSCELAIWSVTDDSFSSSSDSSQPSSFFDDAMEAMDAVNGCAAGKSSLFAPCSPLPNYHFADEGVYF